MLVAAIVLAVLFDLTNLDKDPPFDPTRVVGADLAIFAGFFAAATILERVIEFAGPFIPWWDYPGKDVATAAAKSSLPLGAATARGDAAAAPTTVGSGEATDAAIKQKKADRGYGILGLATLLGVLVSAGSGLYFAQAIGMDISRWADILVSGIAISGGTKGLHELIKTLQKAKGSGTTAG